MKIQDKPDGSIEWVRETEHAGVYIFWKAGERLATVDGRLTADELEQIAAHMREHSNGKSK